MSSEFFRLALFALMAAIVWLQLGRDHQTHVTRHHLRVRLLQIYAGHEWLCIRNRHRRLGGHDRRAHGNSPPSRQLTVVVDPTTCLRGPILLGHVHTRQN